MAPDPSRATTSADPSDDELVARFLDGDREAFGALVQRHTDRVYALCLRYFRDTTDAEDAAQEVFVVVYRKLGSFVGSARFTTWLHRVTMNVCHDQARRRASRPQSSGVDPHLLPQAGPDEIRRLELDLDLRRGLDKLDDEQRRMVVWHSVMGVPYKEIADATGLPVGTVKSRIHRAQVQLAGAVGHLRSGEP